MFVSQVLHLTRDGEYYESREMLPKDYELEELSKVRQTYSECHAWVFDKGQWYSTPGAGIGFGRWTPELEKNIPMCVRMAEIVR